MPVIMTWAPLTPTVGTLVEEQRLAALGADSLGRSSSQPDNTAPQLGVQRYRTDPVALPEALRERRYGEVGVMVRSARHSDGSLPKGALGTWSASSVRVRGSLILSLSDTDWSSSRSPWDSVTWSPSLAASGLRKRLLPSCGSSHPWHPAWARYSFGRSRERLSRLLEGR